MKQLGTQAVKGGFVRGAGQAAELGIRVASMMVLARLVSPRDFGLVAMVTAITGLMDRFRDFGLSTAAIQSQTISERQSTALFWVNVAIGAGLTILLMIAAPFIAGFYREPRLLWITTALSLGFIVNAAGIQHAALLKRQMRFQALTLIRMGARVASVIVAIALAWAGFGYWALVSMLLVVPFGITIGNWLRSGWLPGRPTRQENVSDLLRFGGSITMQTLITYTIYNLDKVLIGRVWGAEMLGLYQRSYQLMRMPIDSFNASVTDVAISGLSRVQDDAGRFRNYFLKGFSLTLALTVPITVACGVFADDVVAVFLGPQWTAAARMFQLMTPTILVVAIINPLWWLLIPLGMIRRSFTTVALMAPIVIGSYVLGLPYGAQGVALSFSIAMVLWVVPHVLLITRGTMVSFKDMATSAAPALASAFIAAVPGYMLARECSGFPAVFRLAVGLAVMLSVYVGLLLSIFGQKELIFDVVRRLGVRTSSVPGG